MGAILGFITSQPWDAVLLHLSESVLSFVNQVLLKLANRSEDLKEKNAS